MQLLNQLKGSSYPFCALIDFSESGGWFSCFLDCGPGPELSSWMELSPPVPAFLLSHNLLPKLNRKCIPILILYSANFRLPAILSLLKFAVTPTEFQSLFRPRQNILHASVFPHCVWLEVGGWGKWRPRRKVRNHIPQGLPPQQNVLSEEIHGFPIKKGGPLVIYLRPPLPEYQHTLLRSTIRHEIHRRSHNHLGRNPRACAAHSCRARRLAYAHAHKKESIGEAPRTRVRLAE